MAVKTYIAILHDSRVKTADGRPVQCPLQPDGAPKPTIDNHGVLYRLLDGDGDGDGGPDIYDYVWLEGDG